MSATRRAEVDRAISESVAEFRLNDLEVRKIVRCESKFDPHADSGPYKGLFQHKQEHWSNCG